jgi:hypothetical protein
MNVAFEKDKPYRACQADKQVGAQYCAKNIMTTTRSLKMLHMNLLVLSRTLVLVVTNMVLLLLMIILASLRCSFCKIKVKLKRC